jgi:PAS domain-containing protein
VEQAQPHVKDYVRTVMDAIPAAVFVVDRRVQILDCNAAGLEMLGTPSRESLPKLCGDALQCVHALQSPGRCGTSPFCSDCALRNSVKESMADDAVARHGATGPATGVSPAHQHGSL